MRIRSKPLDRLNEKNFSTRTKLKDTQNKTMKREKNRKMKKKIENDEPNAKGN